MDVEGKALSDSSLTPRRLRLSVELIGSIQPTNSAAQLNSADSGFSFHHLHVRFFNVARIKGLRVRKK